MATNKKRNAGSRVVVRIRASLRVGGSWSQSRSAGSRFDAPSECCGHRPANRHTPEVGAPGVHAVLASCGRARENTHGGGLLVGIGQGIGVPATALDLCKDLSAAGTPWVIDAASTADYRQDKGVARLVEMPYHRPASDAAVEQEQPRADPGLPDQVHQALEHLDHGGPVLNADQGHGKALAPAHDIGGGIGMKVSRTAFGLAPVNLGGLLMRLAVVRDQGQVDGHAVGPLAQAFGELSREQSIHSLF